MARKRTPAASSSLPPLGRLLAYAMIAATLLLLLSDVARPVLGSPTAPGHRPAGGNSILVVGSINADTFLPVSRLPTEGENLVALPGENGVEVDVPGGKGCTQAVCAATLMRGGRRRAFVPASSRLATAGSRQQPDADADTATDADSSSKNDGVGGGVAFLGQFGSDPIASSLRSTLINSGVDVTPCGNCANSPSGRGYVFLARDSGKVSAVVVGGSNVEGWDGWEEKEETSNEKDSTSNEKKEKTSEEKEKEAAIDDDYVDSLLRNKSCVLLQREIPEFVNRRIARRASVCGVTVMQDVGGEDRPMDPEMLGLCDYLIPNESELRRLVRGISGDIGSSEEGDGPSDGDIDASERSDGFENDLDDVVRSARILQRHGANHVLVTLGSRGSVLIRRSSDSTTKGSGTTRGLGTVTYVPPCPLPPNSSVIDETGAGDCYRAAFAVALTVEGLNEQEAMEFASAAGALAVTRRGAVPGVPEGREEVEELLLGWKRRQRQKQEQEQKQQQQQQEEQGQVQGQNARSGGARGGGNGGSSCGSDARVGIVGAGAGGLKEEGVEEAASLQSLPRGGASGSADDDDGCPLMFGSRLNSMKDRPELWPGPLNDVRDWVKRQGTIEGLGCVDFNYPQHFGDMWTVAEAREALNEAGLVAGAVCLRYPSKFARGAMNHPDPELRREAIELTKQAAEVAKELGCDEVVVWSAYDGYDYPFQVNYDAKWTQIVHAFRECCDAFPDIKFSLEFKPTDENTRFFTVPSTGAAILLVREVDRPNMGLTLDVGHMLMAGENPGQSIAMVGQLLGGDRLFGVQLNDGYTRLAAEDGMMFGSVHPSLALEVMYQLRRIGFGGHLYFDTFPQRTDPVREAEYNINRVKDFWRASGRVDALGLREVTDEHDALGAVEIVDEVLKGI